jgi:hypothetical protein
MGEECVSVVSEISDDALAQIDRSPETAIARVQIAFYRLATIGPDVM